MTRLAGSKVLAEDYQFPTVVTAFGNGTNTITATVYTDLPTTACVASITNPHPTANMIVLVEFGGWLAASANAVRCSPRVSGSVTIAAGIGLGGAIGYGEIAETGSSPNPQQKRGMATYTLGAGTATFTMQAFRDSAAGTQSVNYVTLRLIPLYYDL